VVDDSFDMALLVRFTNVEALHAYEKDPRHMKEVNEVLLPLTKKVQVYDFTR
jgi:pantothenate kinase